MRRASVVLIGAAALCMAGHAAAQDVDPRPDHRVERGDTLWDLSGRYWNDPATWPELWALNPHFRNPHFIFPGDSVFLRRERSDLPAIPPEDRVVRLPLERLEPPWAAAVSADAGEAARAPSGKPGGEAAGTAHVSLPRGKGLDFIAPRRLDRLGTVDNRHQVKVGYATGEDLEFALSPGASVRPGDRLSLVDDAETVSHPLTGQEAGYYVRVLGELEVLAVQGDRAVGWLAETYDAVEDGDGVIAYRRPVGSVTPRAARAGVDGLILRGAPGQLLFASDDVVFLDRGSAHGLAAGATLEIPVREGKRDAQGLVDLGTPLAHLVVVAVQESTATSLVLDSRAALEAGDRFAPAGLSP
ncbi:MAG: LysM domain-containing protein [Thermodesulfobacteriota bacterium]